MICVRDFVANLSRTLSQSRRNGILALLRWEGELSAGLQALGVAF